MKLGKYIRKQVLGPGNLGDGVDLRGKETRGGQRQEKSKDKAKET